MGETLKTKSPSLLQSFAPLVVLIVMLAFNVVYYGADSSYGANQIALILAAAMAVIVGFNNGVTWKEIEIGIIQSISSAMSAAIILLLIGALAGTWLMSGIVPAMIYYGLQVLSPGIFLIAACIICCVVSLATGSSWSTIATVGIALLGIGQALGVSDGWTAGAIISGAYFGDKMSPLSDTTNLAPAVAGTDLFTHIRHMVWTTVPSITIALIVYAIVGATSGSEGFDQQKVDTMLSVINEKFNISPWLFVVPVIVLVLIIKKMPAIPALLIGTLLGCVAALIAQPDIVFEIAGEPDDSVQKAIVSGLSLETGVGTIDGASSWIAEGVGAVVGFVQVPYQACINSMALETNVVTGTAEVDALLKGKGMYGMLNTVWLIICALTFGGAMQAVGLLKRITQALLTMVNSVGSLIATTAGTCLFFNVTASDQYLAIVVPGKMFEDAYDDYGLARENLSRTLEDTGTVTSVLIPWNTCGVAQSGVLGIGVMAYAPFCIFNWVSPLMTVLFGYLGWKLTKANKKPATLADDAATTSDRAEL